MLKDIKLMIDFIKEASSIICEKEVFFYDFNEDKWYSREHSGYVEFEEVIDWLKDNIYPMISEPLEFVSSDCLKCIKYEDGTCNGELTVCSDYENKLD